MRFPLTAMVLGCCVASCQCAAEEPAPVEAAKPAPTFKEGPVFTFTAECQIVTLPQKAALKLLPDLIDERKIDAAYDRLQAMLLANEADLVGNLIVKTQEGVQAESQSIDELSYPTEWEPPNLPDLKDVPKADMAAIVKNWPLVGFQPTAFETRNLGPHLEFTPLTHSPDGRIFEVTVKTNDVRIRRVDFFSAGVTPAGKKVGMERPQFHSITNTSTLRLQNGQRTVLGAHKIPGAKGLMEIFLLRVTGNKAP